MSFFFITTFAADLIASDMKQRLIIVVAALCLMAGCGGKQEERKKAPIRVKTEVLSTGAAEAAKSFVGVVEEANATAVSFTGMGAVRRVYVDEGQNVSKGQLIAELDDTQARNILVSAQAGVTQAEDALQRYSLLHERGSLTDAQWVEIQSKVTQARSQLAVAKKNLADCRLVAPVSGVVGRKNVSAGETVVPSQAVVTLLDVSSVNVKFSVPEAEMRAIDANTPALITVGAIGRSFAGGHIEKGVQADALTHTYDVRVRVNNKDRELLPGMVAEVSLGSGSFNSHLTVPLVAIQRRANGSLFVWTVDDAGVAHRSNVELGRPEGNRMEIINGLAAGQRVITDGYQKVSEGSEVCY